MQNGIELLNGPGYKQQWFSAMQLCAWLGIGKTTFYRWVSEGRFPEGKRMGKRAIRWHATSLTSGRIADKVFVSHLADTSKDFLSLFTGAYLVIESLFFSRICS